MIYFLHGPDTFRSREKLREITAEFEKRAGGILNITRIDAGDNPAALLEIGRSGSLFAPKELVVIEGVSAAPAGILERIRGELKRWRDDRNLSIVVWEREPGEKRPEILLTVEEYATKSQEFKLLAGPSLRRWLDQELDRRGLHLEQQERDALLTRSGSDLWAVANELDKIQSGWSDRAARSEEEKVWSFTDEYFSRPHLSIRPLERLLAAGYEPIYLQGALAGSLRTLAIVWHGLRSGKLKTAAAGLHPYVLRKTAERARLMQAEDLRSGFTSLLAVDLELKTGKLPPPLPLIKLALSRRQAPRS